MTTTQGTALAAALLAAALAPAGAPAGEISPSAVLRRADARLGSESPSLPEGASPAPGGDRTLAPYFHVAGSDEAVDRLPLEETGAEVQISGVIARVKVRQLFRNAGRKPIEAIYVFPASTRAAVHGMRMRIGERTIEARVDRRDQARAAYQQARTQGRRASLLEQERPNVFTMSVANVMPGDRIQVELDYSELLVPEDSVYEFVYPTVVGPRYGGGAHPSKDRWIQNPYLREGERAPYRFGLTAHVETGIPLKELSSPSHGVSVTYRSPSSADLALRDSAGGNRDFVLRYRLAGDRIETGLLLFQGERERFFALLMEPPQRPSLSQVPPREFVFLLDVSGSMHGFPLDTAKALMKSLLSQLRPEDSFDVALFSGANHVLSPSGSLPATPANVEMALRVVDRQQGGGGTELMGGLEAAYGIPRRERGISRSVVLVTDGYVGVEARAFRFVRERLGQANLFAFGIGSSVNRGLIEGMARAGLGEPFVVLRPEKAQEEARRFREYVERPVLADVRVSFDGLDAGEVAPVKIPDLMARRPLVLLGKYRGEARGRIEVTGTTGGGRFSRTVEVGAAPPRAENEPLRWLWARRWAAMLEDELHLSPAKEIEEAIADLGLSYSLLTRYTSFVAVDSEIVNRSGGAETVKQPLPLPQGVSNLAVGDAVAAGSMGGPLRTAPAVPFFAAGAPTLESKLALRGKGESEPSPSGARPRLAVAAYRASGLTGAAALVVAVEAKLAEVQRACGTPHREVRLKLAVDSSGRVTAVEVAGADRKLADCLRARLGGLASGARLDGKGEGSLLLTLRVVSA